jgi:hypothetical protein
MPPKYSDDVFSALARMMEEFFRAMSNDARHTIFCSITDGPKDDLPIFSMDGFGTEAIPYEVIEGADIIFITVKIPASIRYAPYAAIHPDEVSIYLDEQEIQIKLPCSVNIIQSHYSVRHGIMDVVCKKLTDQ